MENELSYGAPYLLCAQMTFDFLTVYLLITIQYTYIEKQIILSVVWFLDIKLDVVDHQ